MNDESWQAQQEQINESGIEAWKAERYADAVSALRECSDHGVSLRSLVVLGSECGLRVEDFRSITSVQEVA